MNTVLTKCARDSLKLLTLAIAGWAAAGAFFEYWDHIAAGFKFIVAAGGFWHTFSLLVAGTIGASYMFCVYQAKCAEQESYDGFFAWGRTLAILMVLCGIGATGAYWAEIYIGLDCGEWYCARHEWRPWRAVAAAMQIIAAIRLVALDLDTTVRQ